jgi:hypothetical protein
MKQFPYSGLLIALKTLTKMKREDFLEDIGSLEGQCMVNASGTSVSSVMCSSF